MALRLWRRWGAQPFDLAVLERSGPWRWPVTSTGGVLAKTARPAARDGQARHREGQGTRVIYDSGALSALSDEPDGADAWQGRTAWTSRQAGVPIRSKSRAGPGPRAGARRPIRTARAATPADSAARHVREARLPHQGGSNGMLAAAGQASYAPRRCTGAAAGCSLIALPAQTSAACAIPLCGHSRHHGSGVGLSTRARWYHRVVRPVADVAPPDTKVRLADTFRPCGQNPFP
jgi:hypothetical protein